MGPVNSNKKTELTKKLTELTENLNNLQLNRTEYMSKHEYDSYYNYYMKPLEIKIQKLDKIIAGLNTPKHEKNLDLNNHQDNLIGDLFDNNLDD
jgi:hypothetical protein